ncbi:AIR carboxylase family protein [Candidatus Micrarchaeota archaeon]|nr:AIR carboxylase family protein [Candidatus Micrarchaeota archaeon]
MAGKIIIAMGSKSDLEFCQKIGSAAEAFGVSVQYRIASAHRTPQSVLKMAEEANKSKDPIVFIGVAGLSNALSGMLAGATHWPVVTCPPGDELKDIWSSIRMPPGVAHGTVLGAENAALLAVRILSISDAALRKKVDDYLKQKADKLGKDDAGIQ